MVGVQQLYIFYEKKNNEQNTDKRVTFYVSDHKHDHGFFTKYSFLS
jgi:hypothetical protein